MTGSQLLVLLYVVVFVGIFYFLIVRPQQRRAREQQALLQSLKVNDDVITVGGIYGRIKDIKGNVLILQVADNVRIKVDKGAIGQRLTKEGAAPEAEKESKG